MPAASREPANRRSNPPFSTKAVTLREGVAIEPAHIGHHEHRDLLVDQLRDRIAHRAAAFAQLRERSERPGDVVGRRQERLRLIRRAAEHEADAAAFAALVEKGDGAGRALA